MISASRYLEEKIRKGGSICTAQVVFVDVVAYSRRKSHAQIAVIDAFTKAVNEALTRTARKYVEQTQVMDVHLRHDIVIIPLGDGAAIAFPFEGLPDLHLHFTTQLLRITDDANRKVKCPDFGERGWCDCHSSFLLRCGLSEGKVILFRDINGNVNIAGDTVNMAARVMGLADPGQVFFTEEAHKVMSELSPISLANFRKYETRIKHDIQIVTYQYTAPAVKGLNVAIKAGLGAASDNGEPKGVPARQSLGPNVEDAGGAEPSSPRPNPTPIAAEIAGLESRMVLVPKGRLTLGNDEIGKVSVEISHPFFIDKYPATQGLFAAVMGYNPSRFVGDSLPVDSVSWDESVDFCNRLSEIRGLEPVYRRVGKEAVPDLGKNGYRLPTEAEWEYACRSGAADERYGPIDEIAWHSGNSNRQTHEVGLKLGNSFGLHDMLGNVWEWCGDWFQRRYPASPPPDYSGPSEGLERVLRGGSWGDPRDCISASYRHRQTPRVREHTHGFRLVLRWEERRKAERRSSSGGE